MTTPKPSGEVRTVSATGAAKGVKPEAFDLIPTGPLDVLAQFYGTGVVDLDSARGWEPVFNYAMEHLSAFWRGEDTDPASNLPHLICAAAAAAKLVGDETDISVPSGEEYAPLIVIPGGRTKATPRYDRIPAHKHCSHWGGITQQEPLSTPPVSYTHLTLPTIAAECRSRWSPSH